MKFVDLDSFDLISILRPYCRFEDCCDIEDEIEKKVLDAIQVVRCKNCKLHKTDCCYMYDEDGFVSNDDDFCSYGERKDEYDENYIQEYKN